MPASSPAKDPTVLATPFYFATMAAEHLVLKRRAALDGPTAGDYEKRDTLASLSMGVLSLVAPVISQKALKPFTPGRGRFGRHVVVGALTAAATTTAADFVARRRGFGRPKVARAAEKVATGGGVATVVLGGTAIATTWQSRTAVDRMWRRGRRRRIQNPTVGLAAAIGIWDFIYYWNHRFIHEARYMWAIHVVHHSSERYNLSTALRQPVLDALGTPVPYSLVCLAGLSPDQLNMARGINLLYQYWIHTEVINRLGPAETTLNTPSHHRVHHGSNKRYIDRNHGSILIIWDKLFGTFEPETEDVIYGLTKNIDTFNSGRIATHEFASILRDVAASKTWRDRVSFVVRGPGWADRRRREMADTALEALIARQSEPAGIS
jgi:sterol desaturase/sphingolipid hydroxylase (fatty acid hydroxylase superfamily)